jgi:hypothetical protein
VGLGVERLLEAMIVSGLICPEGSVSLVANVVGSVQLVGEIVEGVGVVAAGVVKAERLLFFSLCQRRFAGSNYRSAA